MFEASFQDKQSHRKYSPIPDHERRRATDEPTLFPGFSPTPCRLEREPGNEVADERLNSQGKQELVGSFFIANYLPVAYF